MKNEPADVFGRSHAPAPHRGEVCDDCDECVLALAVRVLFVLCVFCVLNLIAACNDDGETYLCIPFMSSPPHNHRALGHHGEGISCGKESRHLRDPPALSLTAWALLREKTFRCWLVVRASPPSWTKQHQAVRQGTSIQRRCNWSCRHGCTSHTTQL